MAGAYRKGKSKTYVSWWIDEHGKRRTKAVFADKSLAHDLARRNESECRQVREGLIPAGERSRREASRTPLGQHVEDYRLHLLAKGGTAKHAGHVAGVLARLLESASIRTVAEVTAAKVQGALGRWKAAGKSARTCNHALAAAKAWCGWLAEDDRIAAVPKGFKSLRPFNEEADRKRVRRALTLDELARLLAAAESGPDIEAGRGPRGKLRRAGSLSFLTGPERAALYRLAMGTGFRANELRSLTLESFKLDGDRPTVTVAAAYSKNGREAVQPITRDLADGLRPFVEGKGGGRPVLTVPEKTAKMLRADLDAAGIPYETAEGVVDFHALRHGFISHLIQSGVDPKTVQELARHSTITLTIDRYSHTDDTRKRKALEGDK